MGLTSDQVKAEARRQGFDLCGIAPVDAFPELTYFREWIDRGYHGEMHYLARSVERRRDVRAVLPSARAVIVLGTLYAVDRPYSIEIADPDVARIARYAWGDDYHVVIGRRMEALLAWMRDAHGTPFEARPYVDTGPVQERAYAQRAGVGWVGKNTCLINPGLGSFLFLSEILCSLPLEPDESGVDQCGDCTLCLEACPTAAFVEPYVMDARRCLSYLTIELKGALPGDLAEAVGPHVYGCDICQEVCPWNQAVPVSHDPAWQPRAAFDRPRLADLRAMSDEDLRAALRGSAMKRAGVEGLRRNLAAAQGRPNGDTR
ncbi:MAG: tRNA epoxyqueuosine(34) reductase QueG [Acidobacteria bacterium]|nr:tRNA epoxyqueuosine(34) reductase QueG [Acidobacteriota bacterium]